MISEAAPAKVNLFLHVLGRRDDGYHLLDSLVVFAGIGDVVHADTADTLSLSVRGPFAAGLNTQGANEPDNLVLRAARGLAALAGVPAGAALVLDKNLPVASGIGGGSADAAATLRLLCRLWRIDPGQDALMRLAATLGADVPACLLGQPLRMGGIGEVLAPGPAMPTYGLLLVNPNQPVSTPEVFRRRIGPFSDAATLPAAWPDTATMARALNETSNDLEPAARALCPAIADTLAWMNTQPGLTLARMSGSGATCFGMFTTPAAASAAAANAPTPWWTWGGAPATGTTPFTLA